MSIRLIAGFFTGLIIGLVVIAGFEPIVRHTWLNVPAAIIICTVIFAVTGDDIGSLYRWLYGGQRRRK
jgi:hypothetical protein